MATTTPVRPVLLTPTSLLGGCAVALAGFVLFALGFDQGLLSGSGALFDPAMLHELAHDSRHLLGVPCH